MKLIPLLERLSHSGLLVRKQGRASGVSFDHLTSDSRMVRPGGLFVAVRGEQADGHQFIDKAVKNGAIAILCEVVPAEASQRFPGTTFAQVKNSRAALAEAAAYLRGDPSEDLHLVGVTGTNGKTTTTFLLHDLFGALGHRSGLIGTIAFKIGDDEIEATHTTPDAAELQKLFRQMVDAGCTHAAMEVSSHALDQQRTRSARFDAAVFTNLTRDHLDYHKSFGHYLAAKKRLFDGLTKDAAALYNLDDPAGTEMVSKTKARRLSYGASPEADFRFEILKDELRGLTLRLDGATRRFRLVGGFNAYNLTAAYAAARALGFEKGETLDALEKAAPVPGRFEQFLTSDGKTVIVDYAHTPDALENVLRTMRATMSGPGRLWCLFGCGGDRDVSKRRVMGAIAEGYADRVVVTSDNPRTEDPMEILSEIRRGMNAPMNAAWIVDRREAIIYIAENAAPGDAILIAGKGHEPYQIIGKEKRHFDDREEVQRHFDARPPSVG